MKAPEYTFKDLIYYVGLFLGIIATYLVLQPLGIHRFVRLILGFLVGAGIGWGLDRFYRSLGTSDDDRGKPGASRP
jgi:hypothetical protein